ncbi:hypothetical protein [Maricaulis sp.]|uniref:hypothetical protein n=1 Tax=Maricaulis sp. TaxID=1486257 RepID=UPI003A8F0B82
MTVTAQSETVFLSRFTGAAHMYTLGRDGRALENLCSWGDPTCGGTSYFFGGLFFGTTDRDVGSPFDGDGNIHWRIEITSAGPVDAAADVNAVVTVSVTAPAVCN